MPQPFELANQEPTQLSWPRKINQAIEGLSQGLATPFVKPMQDIIGGATRFVAPSWEQGVREGVGEAVSGLPRTLAEALPWMLRRAPGPTRLLGLGDVALREFGGTPPEATAPQKLGATALGTAGFIAAPEIGGGVGRAVGKAVAPRSYLAKRAGSALGTVAGFEGLGAGHAAIMGQEWNPLTPEHIGGTVAAVLPFEAMGIGRDYGEYLKAKALKEKALKEKSELTKMRETTPEVQKMEVPESALGPDRDRPSDVHAYVTPEGDIANLYEGSVLRYVKGSNDLVERKLMFDYDYPQGPGRAITSDWTRVSDLHDFETFAKLRKEFNSQYNTVYTSRWAEEVFDDFAEIHRARLRELRELGNEITTEDLVTNAIENTPEPRGLGIGLLTPQQAEAFELVSKDAPDLIAMVRLQRMSDEQKSREFATNKLIEEGFDVRDAQVMMSDPQEYAERAHEVAPGLDEWIRHHVHKTLLGGEVSQMSIPDPNAPSQSLPSRRPDWTPDVERFYKAFKEARKPEDLALRPYSFEGKSLGTLINLFLTRSLTPTKQETVTSVFDPVTGEMKKRVGLTHYLKAERARIKGEWQSPLKQELLWSWFKGLDEKYRDPKNPTARAVIPSWEFDPIRESVKKANLDDLYPRDLELLYKSFLERHADRLRSVADRKEDPNVVEALDLETILFNEIRARLFERGLAQNENVVGASLSELISYKERVEQELTALYESGKVKMGQGELGRHKAEVRLNQMLGHVRAVLEKTPGGPPFLAEREYVLGKERVGEHVKEEWERSKMGTLSGNYDIDFLRTARKAAEARGDLSKLPRDHFAFVQKLEGSEMVRWGTLVKSIERRNWNVGVLEKDREYRRRPLVYIPQPREKGRSEARSGAEFSLEEGGMAGKVHTSLPDDFRILDLSELGEKATPEEVAAVYKYYEGDQFGVTPAHADRPGEKFPVEDEVIERRQLLEQRQVDEKGAVSTLYDAVIYKKDGKDVITVFDPQRLEVRTPEQMSVGLDPTSKAALTELEQRLSGYPTAERVAILRRAAEEQLKAQQLRRPNESIQDFVKRSLGLPPEVGQRTDDPFTLLSTARSFFRRAMPIQGWTKEAIDYFEPWFLRFVALSSKNADVVRVFESVATPLPGDRVSSGFHWPGPYQAAPLIALAPSANQSIYKLIHTFAHELGHEHARKGGLSTEILLQIRDLTPEERAQSIKQLADLLTVRGLAENLANRAPIHAENINEYFADMFALVATSATLPEHGSPFKAVHDMVRYGGGPFGEIFGRFISDLSTLFKAVKEFMVDYMHFPKSTADKVDAIQSNMRKLLRTQAEAEQHVQAFLKINEIRTARPWNAIPTIDYDKIVAYSKSFGTESDAEALKLIKEVSPMVIPQHGKEAIVGDQRLSLVHFFTAIPQLVRMIPELADMGKLGWAIGHVVREYSAQVNNIYRDTLRAQGSNEEPVNVFNRLVKEGTPLNRAWSDLLLAQDAWGDESNPNRTHKGESFQVGALLPSDKIREIPSFAKLSPKDQELLFAMNEARGAAAVHSAWKSYDSFRSVVAKHVSKTLMSRDPNTPWEVMKKVGAAFAALKMDQDVYMHNPRLAIDKWGRLEDHQRVVDEYVLRGEKEAAALGHAEEIFGLDENGQPEHPGKAGGLLERMVKYREQLLGGLRLQKSGEFDFDTKPGWSPEVRNGRWIIAHKLKGEPPQFNGYREKSDFDKAWTKLEELAKTPGKVEYMKQADKTDFQDLYAGIDPNKFGVYNDAIETLVKRVIARMGNEHPELSEELKLQLMADLKPQRALAAMLETPHMKERRLIGGRENLNMAEGLLHYYQNLGYTMAKRYEIADQDMYLHDPKMRANPNLQKWARKYFDELNRPNDLKYRGLKQLIAFNYIFFSPSLALIELTQQGTNLIPAMLMRGMGLGEAVNALRKANMDVAQAYLRGRSKKVGYDLYESKPNEMLDAKGMNELTRVMKVAHDKDIVGAGVGWNQEFWELAHDAEFLNKRNMFGGNGVFMNRTGLVGKPLYHLYKTGANLHGIAIALNSKVAFKVAYEHFRKQGMSEERAFAEADLVSKEAMHGGGRASKPLWFLGIGPGSPGAPVGALMYSLQTYVYNTVAQMGNYLHQAIKNTCKDPLEISQAHKAAATMLGAQLVLAGVGGIPVTSQMVALIEQLFPNTEPRRRMREAFFGIGQWLNSKTHLVGNDDDMGQFVMTAALDGLLSTVAPVNMSNRFELGVLLGVDPYRGFDWKNVIGPGGPLLEQILLKPLQAASKGDYAEALTTAFPNSNVRRLVEQATNGWDLRNKDSRLNVQLDDDEKALMALGFTPKRVADFKELDQMKRRAETVHSLEQKKFHESMADRYTKGDQEGVTQSLLQRTRELPSYDPREGARRIAELVLNKTIPFDPLRSGSRTSRSYTIGELFDVYRGETPRPPQSETARYLQRVDLTRQLGFPEQVSRSGLREAQLVEQLQYQYPGMSRMEALEMLQGVMQPRTNARLQGYLAQ